MWLYHLMWGQRGTIAFVIPRARVTWNAVCTKGLWRPALCLLLSVTMHLPEQQWGGPPATRLRGLLTSPAGSSGEACLNAALRHLLEGCEEQSHASDSSFHHTSLPGLGGF